MAMTLDEYKYTTVYEDRPLEMVKIPLEDLKTLFKELIGEDEYKFGDDFDKREVNRDQLRAELRKKVEEL